MNVNKLSIQFNNNRACFGSRLSFRWSHVFGKALIPRLAFLIPPFTVPSLWELSCEFGCLIIWSWRKRSGNSRSWVVYNRCEVCEVLISDVWWVHFRVFPECTYLDPKLISFGPPPSPTTQSSRESCSKLPELCRVLMHIERKSDEIVHCRKWPSLQTDGFRDKYLIL